MKSHLLKNVKGGGVKPLLLAGIIAMLSFNHNNFKLIAQSQNWWRVNGNTSGSTDFLGTTNAADLIFKTNNTERFRITSTGDIILKPMIGNNNRMVMTDQNGKLYALSSGTSNQVLTGNGTWSNISAYTYWQDDGHHNIYYTGGNVGINTNSPQYLLDVGGDARIQNNLYVNGGILVSQKVEATNSLKTDTVRSSSSDVKFMSNVKLKQQFEVDGNSLFNGSLQANTINAATLNISGAKIANVASPDSGLTIVMADQYGNLKPAPIPIPGLCPNGISNPFWHVGGNILSTTGCNYIGSTNAQNIAIISNGIPRINIGSTGHIGINTAAPPTNPYTDPTDIKLEIEGSISLIDHGNASLFFGRETLIGSGKVAEYYGEWGIQYASTTDNGGNTGGLNFWKPYQSSGIGTNGSQNGLLFLSDNGNVGVGCTNPQYRLDVNGTVRAKEVRVKITGCDFVFGREYQLEPLNQRKSKVLLQKHLPNIINADGDTELGIETLSKGLWQNIEEHELYLYEHENKLQQLETENTKLKQTLQELKQEIEQIHQLIKK